MLVLSRKKNESIVINDNISIVIVDIHSDKVRIGVTAPSDVTIHRREVYDAIRHQTAIHTLSKTSNQTDSPVTSESLNSYTPIYKKKPIAKKVIKKGAVD